MPAEYYGNNITGTIHLVEAMRDYGVKNLIFSSSATVYRSDNPVPYMEEYPLGAINPYGWTKVMIERILSDVSAADPEWRVALLRYFNPIGAHESGMIGEDPQGIPNNLLPYVARVAAGALPEIRIFGDDYDTPDGTGVRDYIHVMDLAEGHILAMEKIASDGGFLSGASGAGGAGGARGEGGVDGADGVHGAGVVDGTGGAESNGVVAPGDVRAWNLGTGTGTSVREIIAAFEKACGRALQKSVHPRRAGDLATVYANTDRAKKELGFTARYGIDKMCEDAWRWQQSAGASS
jgi:UDP-glucose 4-epimerase